MAWHVPQSLLEETSNQVVSAGKYYIAFWLVLRTIIVLALGKSTFSGELSNFECDTKIIGCTEMCFNKFSPMSLQRYWTFQLSVVAIPSIAFIVYRRHTLAQVQKISEIRDKIKEKQRKDVE